MTRKLVPWLTLAAAAILFLILCFPAISAGHAANAAARTVVLSDLTVDYDGTEIALPLSVRGFSSPTYRWYKAGSDEPVSDAASLTVRNVSDSGEYRVEVTDESGTLADSCVVTLYPKEAEIVWRTRPSPSAPLFEEEHFIYNGELQGVYPVAENIISGDNVSLSSAGTNSRDAGSHTARVLALSGADATNYTLPSTGLTAEYVIDKAPLDVTVGDGEIAFGDDLSSLPVSASGFFKEEGESVLAGTFVTDYVKGAHTGTYDVSYAFTAANYYLSSVTPGKLTVHPRPVTVTVAEKQIVYGDAYAFEVIAENVPEGLSPAFRFSLSSPHVGERDVLFEGVSSDDYDVTYLPAKYTVSPRRVSLTVDAPACTYGATPTYEGRLDEGSYARGETFSDLEIVWQNLPRSVGTFTLTGRITNPDYVGTVSPCLVTVTPKRVTLRVNSTISVYGEPFVTPSVTALTPLAYDDTVADLDLTISSPESFNAGHYDLTILSCGNANYTVVEAEADAGYGHNYSIEKRVVRVTFDDDLPFIMGNDPIVPSFDVQGTVGADRVEIALSYALVNERGTTDEKSSSISMPGTYSVSAAIDDPSGNYIVEYPRTVRVCGYSAESNGVIVVTQNGFVGELPTVTFLDATAYKLKYQGDSFFQSVIGAFSLQLDKEVLSEANVEVWVPVENENVHYTIGIEKGNGKVTYTPCTVKDGYAMFRTSVDNDTFIIWKDDDNTPFAILSAILLLFILLELAVFMTLLAKYRSDKKYAYAMAPLAGAALFGGAGIYYFAALSAVEGVVAIALLIGIFVLVAKRNKWKNKRG